MMATVFGQKRDANGNLIGHKHKVPTLHSWVYKVKFLDGERQQVSYNGRVATGSGVVRGNHVLVTAQNPQGDKSYPSGQVCTR
jgi:hypothetical protein